MSKLEKLPTGAHIVVCDARKALILVNEGTPLTPRLTVSSKLEGQPVETDELSDRPGRRTDRVAAGGGRAPKSAMETIDIPQREAERFAGEISTKLGQLHERKSCEFLVLAAGPEMLGLLRERMPPLEGCDIHEVPKGLTHLPVDEITRAIIGQ